jgi:hypothetical protein
MPSAPGSKSSPRQPTPPATEARATKNLLFAVPGEHFQLVPAGQALLCVVRVTPEQARQQPQATLSRQQLGRLLYENDIPAVQAAALSAYLNSLHVLPGFDSHAPGRFSLEPGTSRVSQSAWRGGLGELSARYRGWFPQQDLNALRYNHPIFDLRDIRGGLNSVKTSVRSSPGSIPLETYLRGLGDVLGLRSNALAQARQSLYPELPAPQAEALILRNGYISVNEDHVALLRAALRDPANYRREYYQLLANQLLLRHPARVSQATYTNYASLESARLRATSDSVRQQLEAALAALREGLASRVRGNGITTQHLGLLLQFRLRLAASNLHLSPQQLEHCVFPELLLIARHGGGLGGNLSAAGTTGGRGAFIGAGVSVLVELGRIFYDTPESNPRVVDAGIAGGFAGGVGGATQSLVMGSAGSALSRSLVTRGFNSSLASGAGRGLGGFAAGGLAAPVFTATSLALDDQQHSGTDYAALGTRAFVSGALSSALAAGVVGAIWGSEVPVLGNVVGFIVGFGGYYIIDALTGDQVEQGVRQGLGHP